MILLGTQYYRPPFPEQSYWEDDIARIADSGLNTLQLWVVWAWVEAKSGVFNFDDYDKLLSLADKYGLKVVLSTIAEIHPYWIHREVKGSEMVDNMGNTVISSNRVECHYGLTPGGCFDHAGVWDRMAVFLETVVKRYRSESHLAGWDAWNELRWNVHADGLVCYCEHTQQEFRKWLDQKYGGLDGLNRFWKRRYQEWDEVRPGKLPRRSPYTEMMAYCAFISERSNQHAVNRYNLIKNLDQSRPVTVHGAKPSQHHFGEYPMNMPLDRGNDWDFAEAIDGIGTSSFPVWQNEDDIDFAARLDCSASAAGKKSIWLSELQGGRAALGFDTEETVTAEQQQRWIWAGLSRSADAILLWCWRDEVFGFESAGFGMAGADGLAKARLQAMKKTGRIIKEHGALLKNFVPEAAEVGIFFSPWSYYMHWVEEQNGKTAYSAIQQYQRALVKNNIPHLMVEEGHLENLNELKILFMPRTIIVDEATAHKLEEFVETGGTIVCESECGAFDSAGLYRYPEERFLARLTGVAEIGRRNIQEDRIAVELPGERVQLSVRQWLTPTPKAVNAEVLAECEEGVLIQRVPCAKGSVVLCGSYFGDEERENELEFETFIKRLTQDSGVQPNISTETPNTLLRFGHSGTTELIFVISTPGAHVALDLPSGLNGKWRELISGSCLPDTSMISTGEWGVAVLEGATVDSPH